MKSAFSLILYLQINPIRHIIPHLKVEWRERFLRALRFCYISVCFAYFDLRNTPSLIKR